MKPSFRYELIREEDAVVALCLDVDVASDGSAKLLRNLFSTGTTGDQPGCALRGPWTMPGTGPRGRS